MNTITNLVELGQESLEAGTMVVDSHTINIPYVTRAQAQPQIFQGVSTGKNGEFIQQEQRNFLSKFLLPETG